MSEQVAILQNTKCGIKKETTEGTAVSPGTSDGVLLRNDTISWNIGRELLESNYMSGTLSKTAPVAGMYNDGIGGEIAVNLRGGDSSNQPDFHVLLESLFGSESTGYADTTINDVSPTTTGFTVTSAANITLGQLIRVNEEITQVIGISTNDLTLFPPLETAPSDSDTVELGTNYLLTDEDHPTFTTDFFFSGSKKLQFSGCRASAMSLEMVPGQRAGVTFTLTALAPTESYATATAYDLDTETAPPVCLGVNTPVYYQGTATGTPTTTETILSAPAFEVAIGDQIIIDGETVDISNVSGDAGSNITLTHATVSAAASADDTVWIIRKHCVTTGDSFTLTLEMERETMQCMEESAGYVGSVFTGRTVSVEFTPFFKSWQQVMMRDGVVGIGFMTVLGSTANNICAIWMPNIIQSEIELSSDPIMKINSNGRAVQDVNLGARNEIVMAFF